MDWRIIALSLSGETISPLLLTSSSPILAIGEGAPSGSSIAISISLRWICETMDSAAATSKSSWKMTLSASS